MFILKIIVITSTILNIGSSAVHCGSDPVFEFQCLTPACDSAIVNDKISVGRRLISPKHNVTIIGQNDHMYLVKSLKGKISKMYRREVKIFHLANDEHWKFKVNVLKNNLEICESSNQNNEEKDSDSSIAHISTNMVETISKISDGIDSSEVLQDVNNKDTEQYDDKLNNETGSFPSDYDNDIDESVEIESEDESDLDDNLVLNPSKTDSDVAKNLVDEILSTSSVQNLNSDPVDSEKNVKAKTINQQNMHTSTSDKQLENNFSTECSLDSCVNEVKENVATENSRDNISPVIKDDSIQQIIDNIQITQQTTNLDETDNSINESTNNLSPKNINSEISLQDDNNNNGTEEFISGSSYQQEVEHIQTTQEPSYLDKTDNLIKKSVNIEPKISNLDINLQDNNDGTEMSIINSSLQQKSKPIQTTQQLPSKEEKIDVSKKKSVSSNTVLQDSNVVVNLKENNNSTKELSVKSSYQPKSDEVEIDQKLPSVETEINVLIKESVSVVGSKNSNTVEVNNDGTGQLNKSQQEYTNSDSLPAITEPDNQQINNNYKQPPLLEKEKVEVNNENEISINNVMSIGDNLKDKIIYQSVVSETKGDIPVFSNDHKEPKSQNIHQDNLPNVESNLSNNDSANSNTTNSSPLQELINATEIVTSNDHHTTVVNELDITDVLNKKSIDQCTSDGCLQSLDKTPNHDYEIIQHQHNIENKELPHENIHKNMEYNNNEQLKEFVPKSFVASFGHPDTCSGVNCLNFKRNVDKLVKSPQPLNLVPKNLHPDEISHSVTNNDYEKKIEKENIINEIPEQSEVKLSLLDHIQNWLSSPTMITIDFVWNIFGDNSSDYNDVYPDAVENQKMLEYNKSIKHSELYFIVVAVVTLLFSLIYYKYQTGTYENHLLTLLAVKDQNLLIIEKELLLLKELNSGNTQSTTERNSEIESLSDHLTKSEDIISSQAIRIENLEQEIVELTENGMEMHTLLSSALESSTKNKEQLNALKVKLVDSENLIAALTKKNFEKSTELEKQIDIGKALSITVDELANKNNSLAEDKAKLSLQLEEVINKNMIKESKLQSELNSLQDELDNQTHDLMTAENEALLSKEALQEIMTEKFNLVDSKQFLSSVKLSSELKSAKQISEGYKHKLNEALKSNQQFLDHIEVLKSDIVNLESNCSKLETMNEESENKLNILTKFFKEQEQEYLKQINEKAVLCDDIEGESSDLNERIKSLNQEIYNYKSEIQSLKKEITDQETSYKIQLSAADKKASDYWISFRQAERKLKEMELETAQLRNKLTMVDKKLENGAKSIDSSKDFEDELLDIPLPTVSPDFTLLTLLDFEPPPPILTNQRLPPLGALGKAPSPPAPLSRRHNRSLSPGSPPPLQRSSAFRPLAQRYNYMNRENSLGHSVESLDK